MTRAACVCAKRAWRLRPRGIEMLHRQSALALAAAE